MTALAVPRIELPWEVLRGPDAHDRVMAETERHMIEGMLGSTDRAWRLGADKFIRGVAVPARRSYRDMIRRFASFGGTFASKNLDACWNDGAFPTVAPWLALGTGAIADSDIGASFGGTTEANYTGYLRLLVGAADNSAAVAASPATKTNTNAFTFAACTASSAVVIAFCTVNGTTSARLNAGDIILYGTVTSVTIDTTHTPPTIAIGALNSTLE
jgi:hypothetical protein